jgi:hypothetical protein
MYKEGEETSENGEELERQKNCVTKWYSVFRAKLIVTHLVKKFPSFMEH